ncbi:hypothetical protein WHY20_04345 [Clostridium perfringens]|uniref:hypothetical protein n=1 Tax=Clostridium perfringens TaxID=1502 RepID=UPI001A2C9CA2|nr:hypothetical protein [Clostridium perfringens]ELQ0171755.1 hypothetical protein [Clostridium perfringens]WCM71342.1 hypothetical protein LZD60_08185 [Clostridium perfringens]HAT4312911.1 hypothetical protein [Clostridium perfringens]
MDIFDEIISREDPKVIEKNIRIGNLIDKYESELGDELNTECFYISDDELEEALNRCLKEKIKINDIYPGINDIDDDCDY